MQSQGIPQVVTIPAEHAARFREEAAQTVEYRLKSVQETVGRKERGIREQTDVDAELDRLQEALRLEAGASVGEHTVVVDEHVISTIVGCLLDAEHRLGCECESAETDYEKAWRALAEVATWLGLLEQIDGEED